MSVCRKAPPDRNSAAKAEPTTTEEVKALLKRTRTGEVCQTIENAKKALEYDPVLKGAIRRNELTGRTDLVKKVPWNQSGSFLTEADINQILLYLEHNYDLTSERCISVGLSVAASDCSYHPIRDLLESLEWDGTRRIFRALHHFLGADLNAYTAELMEMHMLAAISRVYHPGTKYDICLCIVGPQGCGKSTFFRYLAMKDEWFTDDLHRLGDKRVFEKLNGHWIVELSEMSATVNAKSIEETKSFISSPGETYRLPYEKFAEDHPRQCVFCGTSNDMSFLPFDRSGNRRFAPVAAYPDRAEVHPMDDEKEARAFIMQMWAEAMYIYRRGSFSLTFSKNMETYARQMQLAFMPEDTEIGQVEAFLDNKEKKLTCIKEIYCVVYGHRETEIVPNWESKKIAEILIKLGWHSIDSRKFLLYGSQKAWEPVKTEEEEKQTALPEFEQTGEKSRDRPGKSPLPEFVKAAGNSSLQPKQWKGSESDDCLTESEARTRMKEIQKGYEQLTEDDPDLPW